MVSSAAMSSGRTPVPAIACRLATDGTIVDSRTLFLPGPHAILQYPHLSLDDEADVHTWLSSGLARAGKWHALYQAQFQPPRQHAVRYDIATGRREIDLSPEFRGAEIALAGLDGFFVADPRRPRRLYAVGNDDDRLACLVSDDAGTTWRDHARTAERWSLYAIGGARWTTAGGDPIGTFTEDVPPADEIDARSRVFFFRIPGAP